MLTPTARRLEALALLQAHPGVSAAVMARRLGVTERTARRDVALLRDLGYRVDAASGRYGGYTLAAGTAMPPLLLGADEALAVALGLRATVGVAELQAAAVTALAKLTDTVPSKLRARLEAIATTEVAGTEHPRSADRETFVALALACRAGAAVRFSHRREGQVRGRARDAQPHRLVRAGPAWYLVACERGTRQWQTYAVDRINDVQPLGIRLSSPPPPTDATTFVIEALAWRAWRYQVRVRLFTAAALAQELFRTTTCQIEPDGDTCVLSFGTDDLDWAARWLVARNVDFDVLEPAELADHLHALGRWLTERYPGR